MAPWAVPKHSLLPTAQISTLLVLILFLEDIKHWMVRFQLQHPKSQNCTMNRLQPVETHFVLRSKLWISYAVHESRSRKRDACTKSQNWSDTKYTRTPFSAKLNQILIKNCQHDDLYSTKPTPIATILMVCRDQSWQKRFRVARSSSTRKRVH